MKKNILLITMCICVALFGINTNVYAAASSPDNGSSYEDLAELKKGYNNSNPTLNVKSKGFVTIYAKSECSASTKKCTYQYQGLSVGESADKLLSSAVKCENGESYISYNADYVQSGGTDVKDEWKGNDSKTSDTTYYWSEDYYITCSNTAPSEGSGQVSLGSSGGSNSTGSSSNTGNTSSNGTSSSSSQNYSSSTTVNNSDTGVETYYIVLAIIAVVAYALMFVVKKYNLFKNI